MPGVLQCKQCSSTDLYSTNGYAYTCRYCHAVTLVGEPGKKVKLAADASSQPGKKLIFHLIIGGIIFTAAMLVIITLVNTGSGDPVKMEMVRMKSVETPLISSSVEPEKKLAATFSDIAPLPDSIGNVYFIGILTNSGESDLESTSVEVHLFDKKNRKLKVSHGYTEKSVLRPGESSPVKILVTDAPKYHHLETINRLQKPFIERKKISVRVSDTRLKKKETGNDWILSGTAKNTGTEGIQYVKIIVTLFDKEKKIIGMDSRHLAQKQLQPGEETPFETPVSLVKGTPVNFRVDCDGLLLR